ncbi:MAG: hypothetical protein AB7E55_01745 [Pigmentiphaga sp.]
MGTRQLFVAALLGVTMFTITPAVLATDQAGNGDVVAGMQWEQWAMGEVAAGRMRHSAYYRGLAERLMKMPETEARDVMVMLMNEAEIESLKFEHGEISRAELSSYLNQLSFLMGQVGKEAQRRP